MLAIKRDRMDWVRKGIKDGQAEQEIEIKRQTERWGGIKMG